MSVQPEDKSQSFYENPEDLKEYNKRVNLNDLVNRMNESKKQERKNNIILSAAAISAVTVLVL